MVSKIPNDLICSIDKSSQKMKGFLSSFDFIHLMKWQSEEIRILIRVPISCLNLKPKNFSLAFFFFSWAYCSISSAEGKIYLTSSLVEFWKHFKSSSGVSSIFFSRNWSTSYSTSLEEWIILNLSPNFGKSMIVFLSFSSFFTWFKKVWSVLKARVHWSFRILKIP